MGEMWKDLCQLFCSTDPNGEINRIRVVIHALLICFFVGLLVILLFGLWPYHAEGFAVAGVGLLLAGGVFFMGGFLGFLFAIPHSPAYSGAETPASQYQPNTNLEQISDWLTKILVGVGLTQLVQLPAALQYFGGSIAPSLGGAPYGGIFSVAILIFFSVDGFLVGYLWTRKYYANELLQSDIKLESEQITAKKNKDNMEALDVAQKILTPQPGQKIPTQAELDKEIGEATEYFQSAIFAIAAEQRYRNAFGGPDMMRTEPIFRSLIHANPANPRYHENLGYVLVTKQPPDWKAGEEEFTLAIQHRLSPDEPYLWYEAYRALCRIHLDENFTRDSPVPADADTRARIADDLNAVIMRQPEVMLSLKARFGEISRWASLNGFPFPS